jgi:hypothetical protein
LTKNRVKFRYSDKLELLKNLNFPGNIFSCEQKIPTTCFLGNEKYLNCDKKNKKNLQIQIIIEDSIYCFLRGANIHRELSCRLKRIDRNEMRIE